MKTNQRAGKRSCARIAKGLLYLTRSCFQSTSRTCLSTDRGRATTSSVSSSCRGGGAAATGCSVTGTATANVAPAARPSGTATWKAPPPGSGTAIAVPGGPVATTSSWSGASSTAPDAATTGHGFSRRQHRQQNLQHRLRQSSHRLQTPTQQKSRHFASAGQSSAKLLRARCSGPYHGHQSCDAQHAVSGGTTHRTASNAITSAWPVVIQNHCSFQALWRSRNVLPKHAASASLPSGATAGPPPLIP